MKGTEGIAMEEYMARESAMRKGSFPEPDKKVGGGSEARKGIGILKENPKQVQAQKDGKTPYEYLVLSVLEDDAYVHQHGGDKYGMRNWQIDEIRASTYIGAMFRHYKAWCEGEDLDPDSKRPHLTHLRACCAVVMDAIKHDKLIDDRLFAESKEPADDYAAILDETTPLSKVEDTTPDVDCVTQEDGSCIADEPCMHTPKRWVVIETLAGCYDSGNIQSSRGYGPFSSKQAAKDYGRIVHRASAFKNYCSVMLVNNVKNIRPFR